MNEEEKMTFVGWVVIGIVIIVVIGIVLLALRYFTNVTTVITENKMEGGVVCYMATTSDGAALSCIKYE